jgi:hypothetical protein
MSVFDENRRKCNSCGKMINHWEDNDCDKGLCVRVESVYGFPVEYIPSDLGKPLATNDKIISVKDKLISELEKHIRKEITEELFKKGDKVYQETLTKVKNDSTLSSEYISNNLRFAESLKTVARFLSDPQDYS